MPSLNAGHSIAFIAGCAVLSLALVGEAPALQDPREGAGTKASAQDAPPVKRQAVRAGRSGSVQEEPFCVRPFEYPRMKR